MGDWWKYRVPKLTVSQVVLKLDLRTFGVGCKSNYCCSEIIGNIAYWKLVQEWN